MTMHDERWTLGVAENGDVRLRDLKTGETLRFGGPRGLYYALGQLADWREGLPPLAWKPTGIINDEKPIRITCQGERDGICSGGPVHHPDCATYPGSRGVTDSDFYDEPSPIPMTMGPVFVASYESECWSCFELIRPGEDIRADGRGQYIHADTMCEKVARER